MRSSNRSFPELISFLDGQPEPSIVMDAEYRIVAANKAYAQEFAQGRNVNGQFCYAVSHHFEVPCDQAGESCPLRMSRQSGQMHRVLHLHHAARRTRRGRTAPIRDEQGRIAFFVEALCVIKQASAVRPPKDCRTLSSFGRMLSLVVRVAPTGPPCCTGRNRTTGTGHAWYTKPTPCQHLSSSTARA
jgi:hypothetical protein